MTARLIVTIRISIDGNDLEAAPTRAAHLVDQLRTEPGVRVETAAEEHELPRRIHPRRTATGGVVSW